MSAQDNGGPAFPTKYVKHARGEVGNSASIIECAEGMTLRDYFAAHAPLQLADARDAWHSLSERLDDHNYSPNLGDLLRLLAKLRHDYADAMLAERAK